MENRRVLLDRSLSGNIGTVPDDGGKPTQEKETPLWGEKASVSNYIDLGVCENTTKSRGQFTTFRQDDGYQGKDLEKSKEGLIKGGKTFHPDAQEDGKSHKHHRDPVERASERKQLDLFPLEHKSSSTQTVEFAEAQANSNQITTDNNTIVVVTPGGQSYASGGIHFKFKSKDLLIDIRKGEGPESSTTDAVMEESRFESVNVEPETEVETFSGNPTVSAATRDGTLRSRIASSQDVKPTIVPVPGQAQGRSLHGTGMSAEVLRPTKQVLLPDVSKGSQKNYFEEELNMKSSVREFAAGAKTTNRRNTFPQVAYDSAGAVLVEGKRNEEVFRESAVLGKGESEKSSDERQDTSVISEHLLSAKQLPKIDISETGDKCFVTEITTSSHACLNCFDESGNVNGLGKNLKDECATNTTDLVGAQGVTPVSLGSSQSRNFQEDSCQASLSSVQDQTQSLALTSSFEKTDYQRGPHAISNVVSKQDSVTGVANSKLLTDRKAFHQNVGRDNDSAINENFSRRFGETAGELRQNFTNDHLSMYSKAAASYCENKDALPKHENLGSTDKNEAWSEKSSCECQVSFPETFDDSENSISSTRCKIPSSNDQVIAVQRHSCSCLESEQSGSVAENSYDLNCDEMFIVSLADFQVETSPQCRHVHETYRAFTDQNNVGLSFQKESQNYLNQPSQSNKQTPVERGVDIEKLRTEYGVQNTFSYINTIENTNDWSSKNVDSFSDANEIQRGIYVTCDENKTTLETALQGTWCNYESCGSRSLNKLTPPIESNRMNNTLTMMNAVMLGNSFREEAALPGVAWVGSLQTISEAESKVTRNISQQTKLQDDSSMSGDDNLIRLTKSEHNQTSPVPQHDASSVSWSRDRGPWLEKTESSKVKTDSSIKGRSQSDEDPACLTEQLNHGSPRTEETEESTTAKSMEELTEEDFQFDVEMTMNTMEKMSSGSIVMHNKDNLRAGIHQSMSGHEKTSLTTVMNSGSTRAVDGGNMAKNRLADFPVYESSQGVGKKVSSSSVRRSSSGVRLFTLDDNGGMSSLVKISDAPQEVNDRMSVVENQVQKHLVPNSSSPVFPSDEQVSPTNAHPDVLNSTSSLSCGTTHDKDVCRSEVTRKRLVEWTPSVKDTNGVERQRTVDIVTETDPIDQVKTISTENGLGVVETPCCTQVSTSSSSSSLGTRVLKHSSSCHSLETNKNCCKVISNEPGKTENICKSAENHATRTKFERRVDKKPEIRNRVHLKDENGFICGKVFSKGGTEDICLDDYHKRRRREARCPGKDQMWSRCSCDADVERAVSGTHALRTCNGENIQQ